eukprot:8614701-Pyramimonas_sp.AAC.1
MHRRCIGNASRMRRDPPTPSTLTLCEMPPVIGPNAKGGDVTGTHQQEHHVWLWPELLIVRQNDVCILMV